MPTLSHSLPFLWTLDSGLFHLTPVLSVERQNGKTGAVSTTEKISVEQIKLGIQSQVSVNL